VAGSIAGPRVLRAKQKATAVTPTPAVQAFRRPLAAINYYLAVIHAEALARGYAFDRGKLSPPAADLAFPSRPDSLYTNGASSPEAASPQSFSLRRQRLAVRNHIRYSGSSRSGGGMGKTTGRTPRWRIGLVVTSNHEYNAAMKKKAYPIASSKTLSRLAVKSQRG